MAKFEIGEIQNWQNSKSTKYEIQNWEMANFRNSNGENGEIDVTGVNIKIGEKAKTATFLCDISVFAISWNSYLFLCAVIDGNSELFTHVKKKLSRLLKNLILFLSFDLNLQHIFY